MSKSLTNSQKPTPLLVPVRGRLRRLHLSERRERRLEEVAREVNVRVEAPDGSPTSPGWRALVYAIGEGLVEVRRPAGEMTKPEIRMTKGAAVVRDRRFPGEWD